MREQASRGAALCKGEQDRMRPITSMIACLCFAAGLSAALAQSDKVQLTVTDVYDDRAQRVRLRGADRDGQAVAQGIGTRLPG